ARAQAKGRVAAALLGMPLGVIMLEHAQTLPDRQRLMREAVIVPGLRECVVQYIEIAGDKLVEKMKRDAERGPMYEQADRIIAHLWRGAPLDPADAPAPGPVWPGATEPEPGDQAGAPGGPPGWRAPPVHPQPAPRYAHPYAELLPRQ